jgi:hypothetical protein
MKASVIAARPKRNQAEARRVATKTYPFKCCAICGMAADTVLDLEHLDQNHSNNDPDNLAWLCKSHHWMHGAGLYPTEGVKLLRDHWQVTKGVPDHAARMKDAGPKAALTRRRRAAARKAVATRMAKRPVPGQ